MKGEIKANMKFLLILPLLAVVFVSGCVGGGNTGTSGNGVVILEFRPDFTQVYSDDPVKLQLRIQNQGEVRARNVKAELTGINTAEWQQLGYGITTTEYLGDLQPYDPATNTPGAIKTKTWYLRAPMLAKGIDFTYTPIAKVGYDYTTTAQKPITIVDEDELRRIKQQGGTLPSGITTYTAGPLAVEITTGDYVKTESTGGTTYDVFPIHIKITNLRIGNGAPTKEDFSYGGFIGGLYEEYDYPISVEITPPTGTNFVSSGFGGYDDCTTGTIIKDMWNADEAQISCELEVTSPPSYREERLLTVKINYRYQLESTTSIRVFGTQQTGGVWGW